jgi:hypothetical protein
MKPDLDAAIALHMNAGIKRKKKAARAGLIYFAAPRFSGRSLSSLCCWL